MDDVQASFETSLKALDMDYVDLVSVMEYVSSSAELTHNFIVPHALSLPNGFRWCATSLDGNALRSTSSDILLGV